MPAKNTKSVKIKKVTKSSNDTKIPDDSAVDSDISLSDSEKNSNDSAEEVQEEEENDKLSDDDMGIDDEDQDSEPESDIDSDKDADDCIYKYTKSGKIFDDGFDDNLDKEYTDGEDADVEKITDDNRYVKPEDRIGKPYLFKFERVRLLQDRATQLANGSNPMIKNVNHPNPKQIAKLELETGKIPLYIERELPGGKIEAWYVPELKQSDREYIQDASMKINIQKISNLSSDS